MHVYAGRGPDAPIATDRHVDGLLLVLAGSVCSAEGGLVTQPSRLREQD